VEVCSSWKIWVEKNGGREHLKCEKKIILFEEEGQAVTDTDPIIGEGK